MREFSKSLDDLLTKGLRPFNKRSKEFQIYDLFNFKPTKFGIVPYDPMTLAIPDASLSAYGLDDEVFPFPQLIVGKKYSFVCCVDRIFIVDPQDWSAMAELTTYDADNPSNTKSIQVGGVWELADFWDTWFLTNGRCTVFACGKDWIEGTTQKVFVSDATPIKTAVDYKGRLLLGGFDVNNFWSDTANTFMATFYNLNYDTGFNPYVEVDNVDRLAPVYDNFVWWSSIGGGDALLFFFPSEVFETGFLGSAYYWQTVPSGQSARPFILEMLQMNTQGFAPMPAQGQVVNFRELGDYLIAMSEHGVVALKNYSGPEPTIAPTDLNLGGISNRGAVASSKSLLVYIDNSGMLNVLGSDLSVQFSGYREFFYPLLGTDIIISYSPNPIDNSSFGAFYISNGQYTFILNERGLFESGQIVTSVAYREGGTIGLGNALVETADIVGRIGIDANDFELPGLKTVEWVRVEIDETSYLESPTTSLQVSLDFLYSNIGQGDWNSTSFKNINKEGLVYFPITANKFRINIKVSDYANFDIISFEVGIKHGDKRYTRHFQTNAVSSRANP